MGYDVFSSRKMHTGQRGAKEQPESPVGHEQPPALHERKGHVDVFVFDAVAAFFRALLSSSPTMPKNTL